MDLWGRSIYAIVCFPLFETIDMKKMNLLFGVLTLLSASCGDKESEGVFTDKDLTCTPSEISVDCLSNSVTVNVTAIREWTVYSDEDWISCHPTGSIDPQGTVTVTVSPNQETEVREGKVVVKSGKSRIAIPVRQGGKPEALPDPDIQVPEGYKLVWQDEFNDKAISTPDESLWWYENGAGGWGNNELQTYIPAKLNGEVCAKVDKGTLKIIAKKVGSEVYSVRMNTIKSWKYGYFEARLKLPVGKGTWPAFWMMPKNFTAWPDDGEIDIMEEVGYHPNYVSSSIHCKAYNHSIGTQKTREILLPTAQQNFHVYALEWTEDFIRTYVDGKELFFFENDKKNNKNTWPFNTPFYLKLNLAWGGNWGGAQGVDESCLPATYEIDYVRVFQKK